MLWSWYLADDTQFYVLGCALLILAVRLVLSSNASSRPLRNWQHSDMLVLVLQLLPFGGCTHHYIPHQQLVHHCTNCIQQQVQPKV
jgi:hypothetical protein